MGRLFVFSSPSGCGKTTVIRNLLERNPDFRYSISATTRPPRREEKNGVHYHFLSVEDFQRKTKSNAFYEWAQVHGNYYGTLKGEVDRGLREGPWLLLDLDVQGGLSIKKQLTDSVLIFLLPPSMKALRQRLAQRGTESPEDVDRRLHAAEKEMLVADRYDFQVVNHYLESTVGELEKWIRNFSP